MSIYLDNAATSFPKAPGVSQAVYHALNQETANANRSSYDSAVAASKLLYSTRKLVADYFRVAEPKYVIFTSGATEGLNTVIQGILSPGATVLTTPAEHNAVARPLRYLQQEQHIEIRWAACDRFGRLQLAEVEQELSQHRPDLFVWTAQSNVTGAQNPVAELITLCERLKVPYLIDGAAAAGDLPIDLSQMAHGAFCCSAHKGLLAPTGLGLMMLSENLLPEPLMQGGTGSRSQFDLQPDFLPDAYESGTRNIHAIAGLQASMRYLTETPTLPAQQQKITDYLYEQLSQLHSKITILSPELHRGCVISFLPVDIDLGEFSLELQDNGIAHRMGLHCAPWTHHHTGTLKTGGTIRLSPGPFTTVSEIDQTVECIKEIIYG
ncbi:MAG: aminotransferase class V-fold PLP-dependent enzyme [Spirochaetota bacterium]